MWPDYYPKDCPPSEAEEANGTYYRMVHGDPIVDDDFRPVRIENPHRDVRGKECEACAVSLYGQRDDAIKIRKYPAHRHKLVAIGEITGQGLMVRSRTSSHVDWWVPSNTVPVPMFRIDGTGK